MDRWMVMMMVDGWMDGWRVMMMMVDGWMDEG